MSITRWIALALIASVPVWVGCDSSKSSGGKSNGSSHDHDHDHDHDHGDSKSDKKDDHAGHDHPEHGPNGGHIAHFDSSPTTHFEWAHDEEKETLTVYFEELVSGGNKIDSVEVVVTSSGQEKKFKLEPLDSAKIAGSIFQIKDKELLTLVGASGDDEKESKLGLSPRLETKRKSSC